MLFCDYLSGSRALYKKSALLPYFTAQGQEMQAKSLIFSQKTGILSLRLLMTAKIDKKNPDSEVGADLCRLVIAEVSAKSSPAKPGSIVSQAKPLRWSSNPQGW